MDILNKIKQIQALSEIGVHYSGNDFDRERYREIGMLSLDILSELSHTPVTDLGAILVESDGYKTAKVDVRAVVFNDQGEILMVREKIDGCWSLPGGWADVGFTPAEIAVKESREEAGARVEPSRLLGIMDKSRHGHPPGLYYIYKVFIECRFMEWVMRDHLETSEAGFFKRGHLPELSTPRITADQISMLFDQHDGKVCEPFFD